MFIEGIILIVAGLLGFYLGDVKNISEDDFNKASQWLQSWTRVPVIGAGWNARLACSGLFVSERHWVGIQNNELSGINSLFFCSPDTEEREVTCSLFGLGWEQKTARYMDPVRGCRLLAGDGTHEDASSPINQAQEPAPRESTHLENGPRNRALDEVLHRQLRYDAHLANQTRAIVVLHKGKLVGQGYSQHLSITEQTKLLGWSMTKSVHALVIGAAIHRGLVALDTPVQLSDFPQEYKERMEGLNGGRALTFGDLIRMSDVLEMREQYTVNGDVPAMLLDTDDAAARSATFHTRKPQEHFMPGRNLGTDLGKLWDGLGGGASVTDRKKGGDSPLGWYYSSGLSNVLAKEFRALFASDDAYWRFPQEALFAPMGIDFVMETDTSGTFVASSLGFAKAQDWAKLGQLLINGGMWNDEQILSKDFVDWALTPHPHSAGVYGGSIWLNPTCVTVEQAADLPHSHKIRSRFRWMTKVLPADAFVFSGFQEQMVLGIPSLNVVIARIGFTKAEDNGEIETEGSRPYSKAVLVREILEALQPQN